LDALASSRCRTRAPRVEYRFTEAGQALRNTVNRMCAWTRSYLDYIEARAARFDSRL
jgi:DNA-binding HxlR family transcriptional regulator